MWVPSKTRWDGLLTNFHRKLLFYTHYKNLWHLKFLSIYMYFVCQVSSDPTFAHLWWLFDLFALNVKNSMYINRISQLCVKWMIVFYSDTIFHANVNYYYFFVVFQNIKEYLLLENISISWYFLFCFVHTQCKTDITAINVNTYNSYIKKNSNDSQPKDWFFFLHRFEQKTTTTTFVGFEC